GGGGGRVHAGDQGGGQRREHVGGLVLAQQIGAHGEAAGADGRAGQGGEALGDLEREADTSLVVQRQLGAADVTGGEAPGDDGGRGAFGHRGDEPVLGVQHGAAVRRERFDELALGGGDRVHTAELAQVGGADVEHEGDVRPGDRGELGDVADPARAHLEHQETGPGGHAQHGQRQAELVVEAPGGGHGGTGGREDRAQQILGAGLAGAAGDGEDHQLGVLLPGAGELGAGQRGQRLADV